MLLLTQHKIQQVAVLTQHICIMVLDILSMQELEVPRRVLVCFIQEEIAIQPHNIWPVHFQSHEDFAVWL